MENEVCNMWAATGIFDGFSGTKGKFIFNIAILCACRDDLCKLIQQNRMVRFLKRNDHLGHFFWPVISM